jgi:hypothetical protein
MAFSTPPAFFLLLSDNKGVGVANYRLLLKWKKRRKGHLEEVPLFCFDSAAKRTVMWKNNNKKALSF